MLREALQLAVEELLAVRDVLLALRALEPLPDLLAGTGGLDHAQPVARWTARGLARDDLDDVAGPKAVVEGHDAVVDLRADRAVADVGVDAVGEVDRRRSRGQRFHLAFRREDEDLVLEDIDLQRLDELLRIGDVVLPFQKLAHPGELRFVALVGLAAFLVAPVRRDAVLRQLVHLARTYLDLERLPAGAHHRRVQRLVEVRLRHGDVIVELTRDRGPQRVYDAERAVARRHVVHDDADREQVIHLVEADALATHLRRDRPEMLGATGELGPDTGLLELGRERLHGLVDVALAHLPPRGQLLGELLVLLRLEVLEREVLELPLDLPDAEAVRERRVDLHRLLRDAPLLLERERRQRAHVVEPVAQLDDDDAQVVGHREEHLPDVLGLMHVARLSLQPAELRHALHEAADLVTELLADVVVRLGRVLGDVVQQRRRDRRGVHPEFGDEHRDRSRMRDVGLAGDALLSLVRLGRIRICASHELPVAVGIVPKHLLHDRLGVDVPVRARAQPLGHADDPRGDRVRPRRAHAFRARVLMPAPRAPRAPSGRPCRSVRSHAARARRSRAFRHRR